MPVKKGNPVEFTREHMKDYELGVGGTTRNGIWFDAEYGIAIEDQKGPGVMVELANGETYLAIHIHAYAWVGYLPPELELAWAKHNDTQERE